MGFDIVDIWEEENCTQVYSYESLFVRVKENKHRKRISRWRREQKLAGFGGLTKEDLLRSNTMEKYESSK